MKILEVKIASQASVIKNLSEALKALTPELNLTFTKKTEIINEKGEKIITGGVGSIKMTMSNNVLMHLKLDAKNFEYYYCAKDKIVAGINTLTLFTHMKKMNNQDTITFFMESEEPNKLFIKFENAQKNMKDTSSINLMDIDDYDEIEIPPTKFITVVNMPSSDFNKICRDLSSMGDVVEIKSINKSLFFTTQSDSGDTELELGESENGVTIETEDPENIFQGLYDLKYLTVFTKCTNLCTNVDIFIKNDYPLVIRYYVASLGTIHLCLSDKSDTSNLEYEDSEDDDEFDIY